MGSINWAERLAAVAPEGGAQLNLMEVCGTHTMVARRGGLHSVLPEGVRLLSGPGCPVCVTPVGYVDHAVAIARSGVTVATFGDLIRVPGSTSSLERERGLGAPVEVVYSPRDALSLARSNPDKLIVFLAVGFETTAPTIAATVQEAYDSEVDNFTVLTAHRLVPPALTALLTGEDQVDAFLAPGHVTAMIGLEPYQFVAREHGRPVVVAGFLPEEMLLAIEILLRMVKEGRAEVHNAYPRVVRDEGNPVAVALLERLFEPCEAAWRGVGSIPDSGMRLRERYARHDASRRVEVEVEEPHEPEGCICGEVLRGLSLPEDCPLFSETCTPAHPVGACMVSSEGSCAAAFRYGRIR